MIEVFYFDGAVKKGELERISPFKNKKMWIDVTNINQQEADILKKTFNLHPLTVEDLLNRRTRIKVEEFPQYLFCVVYGVERLNDVQLVEVDLVLGKNFIISNHHHELGSAQELKNHPEKLAGLFRKGVDFILHKLIDTEIDNCFPVLAFIDDTIESFDDQIKQPHPGLSTKILQLKRDITEIKKTMLTQREKISLLAKGEYPFISPKALPYFRDVYDHAIRVSDALENYREAIASTFEAYTSIVSLNLNQVMRVLSALTALAIPFTVITGIYGTNFSLLPGAESPYGFWGMLIAMFSLVIMLLYFFRKRRWF